jgi:ATP-dependent exoDNAse (exonuclease V) beta subunit
VTVQAHEAAPLLGPGGRAFTPEQALAVTRRDGPLLLSAGAGSGKTSVLVERFVRSVTEDGLRPEQILAITFTDKAAGELRARVRERFLEVGRRDDARDTEAAWVSTIHGFCARVLRAHAVAAGLDPGFAVLDDPGARALRGRAFEAALAAFLGDDRPAALELVAAYTPDRLQTMVCGVHETLRSRGQTRPSLPPPRRADLAAARAGLETAARAAQAHLAASGRSLARIDAARDAVAGCLAALGAGGGPPVRAAVAALDVKPGGVSELTAPPYAAYRDALERFAQACRDARALEPLALVSELLGRYADAYAEAKRERSVLDFTDLELGARDLFDAAPAVAGDYAARFERIMVDEFQDTNPLQLALLDRVARDNDFVVGDALQSIYGFRHADVRGFERRRRSREAAGAAAELTTSFRARPEILATLNAAFGDLHGSEQPPLRPGRDEPPAGEPLVELLLVDAPAFDDDEAEPGPPPLGAGKASLAAEARLVAARVRALADAGACAPGEVAVLLRAVANMAVFERALQEAGFATLPSAGRGWWGRREVLDLTAHLGALANPRDELALLGVLASPLVGLTSDALALLAMAPQRRSLGLWAVAEDAAPRLPPADRDRLEAFVAWFAAERRAAPGLGLDELLERAVARGRYDAHVLSLADGPRRLANVRKLVRLAAAYEARHGRDLRGFIDHARAELDAAAAETDAPVDGDEDAVRLMTIHAAKGLEFGVVVVAELGRQGAGRAEDLLTGDDRVGLRLVGMDGHSEPALAFDELRDELRAADAQEERRVLHVALTRAEERLILSGAVDASRDWPAERPGACPLATVGPRLAGGLPALAAAAGDVEVERELRADAAVRIVLRRSAVEVAAPDSPSRAGEQLALDLTEAGPPAPASPAEPAAPAAPERRPVAGVSYTGLAAYTACPYRFYLQRHLRLPDQAPPPGLEPVPDGLDPRLRGTLAHVLLERMDLTPGAPPPGGDDVRALAAELGAELTGAEVDDLLDLVGRFAAGELRDRLDRAAWLRREHAFAFPLDPTDPGGPMLNGVVDVLAREPGGAMLVLDYKSDRVGDADLEAAVEAGYGTQRRIYALAALRAGAPAVEVVHHYLEPGRSATARYEAGDAPALQAALERAATGLLAGAFGVAPVPHAGLCATCPGRDGLCSWPPEMTDRPLEAI